MPGESVTFLIDVLYLFYYPFKQKHQAAESGSIGI